MPYRIHERAGQAVARNVNAVRIKWPVTDQRVWKVRRCHGSAIAKETGVDSCHLIVGQHAAEHHGLVHSTAELRAVSTVTATGADHEVIVVDGQRAAAAVLLYKDAVDEVLLVGAINARADVSP